MAQRQNVVFIIETNDAPGVRFCVFSNINIAFLSQQKELVLSQFNQLTSPTITALATSGNISLEFTSTIPSKPISLTSTQTNDGGNATLGGNETFDGGGPYQTNYILSGGSPN